jgi:hypothetical protein
MAQSQYAQRRHQAANIEMICGVIPIKNWPWKRVMAVDENDIKFLVSE